MPNRPIHRGTASAHARDNIESLWFPRFRLSLVGLALICSSFAFAPLQVILARTNPAPHTIFPNMVLVVMLFSCSLGGASLLIINSLYARRHARAALRRRFRMCWKCTHPLSLDMRKGLCPECGYRWTAYELRARWANSIRPLRQRTRVRTQPAPITSADAASSSR